MPKHPLRNVEIGTTPRSNSKTYEKIRKQKRLIFLDPQLFPSSCPSFLIPKPFARIEIRYERFPALTEETTTQVATEALGVEMRRLLREP